LNLGECAVYIAEELELQPTPLAAIPVEGTLRRTNGVISGKEITSTVETIHRLLRVDGDSLVLQWQVQGQIDRVGAEIRSPHEQCRSQSQNPHHRCSSEPLDEPPRLFREEATTRGLDDSVARIAAVGEILTLPRAL
jgi:hypothetical protein